MVLCVWLFVDISCPGNPILRDINPKWSCFSAASPGCIRQLWWFVNFCDLYLFYVCRMLLKEGISCWNRLLLSKGRLLTLLLSLCFLYFWRILCVHLHMVVNKGCIVPWHISLNPTLLLKNLLRCVSWDSWRAVRLGCRFEMCLECITLLSF